MAKKLTEREEQMQDPDLFGRSLSVIKSGAAYLGDEDVLRGLLSLVAEQSMDDAKSDDPVAAILKTTQAAAQVFLGKDRRYLPIPKWNAPDGGLVPFLRTWAGADDVDPVDVVTNTLVQMVSELLDIADLAGQPGVLDEEWQWQATDVIERHIKLFQGVSPPDQAIMDG